jgi:hypothetical protein
MSVLVEEVYAPLQLGMISAGCSMPKAIVFVAKDASTATHAPLVMGVTPGTKTSTPFQ